MLGIHRTTTNRCPAGLRHAPRRPAGRASHHRPRRAWTVEALEGRTLLSTWPVTSLDDTGDDSLRWAIDQANANNGDDTVDIKVEGTITLDSALPDLNDTTGVTEIRASARRA